VDESQEGEIKEAQRRRDFVVNAGDICMEVLRKKTGTPLEFVVHGF